MPHHLTNFHACDEPRHVLSQQPGIEALGGEDPHGKVHGRSVALCMVADENFKGPEKVMLFLRM